MQNYQDIQNNILYEYMSLFKRPTISNLAKDSGIQKTRFFRIINGADMRLSEYLTLKDRISILTESKLKLKDLSSECEHLLSVYELSELAKIMSRKLRQKKLEKTSEKYLLSA